MVLLEAMALLRSGVGPVIAVVADEPLPPPLDRGRPYGPMAVAFALTASRPARCEGTLHALAPEPAPEIEPPEVPADVWANPCAPALHLVGALGARRSGRVGLTRDGAPWSVEVQP
jgi:hypothetical protein